MAPRLDGKDNAALPTGQIELVADSLTVLNKAEVPPFPLDQEISNEDLRLSHRYLDLRRPRMSRNLQQRHRIVKTVRDYLDDAGFLEIETPVLSKSTPEGARDFLVPSRLQPGGFYALPQAPQQYKQLLMVAGWKNISRSPSVSATKTCAPTASRNSRRSTSRRASSNARTSSRWSRGCSKPCSKRPSTWTCRRPSRA